MSKIFCRECHYDIDDKGHFITILCPKHAVVDDLLTVINEWAIPSVICLSSFDKEFAQKAMKNILEVIAKTEELKG